MTEKANLFPFKRTGQLFVGTITVSSPLARVT